MLQVELEGEFYVAKMFWAFTSPELFEYYQKAIARGKFWKYLDEFGSSVRELLKKGIIDIEVELKEDFHYVIRASVKKQGAFIMYLIRKRQIPEDMINDKYLKSFLRTVAFDIDSALTSWEQHNIQYRPLWERIIEPPKTRVMSEPLVATCKLDLLSKDWDDELDKEIEHQKMYYAFEDRFYFDIWDYASQVSYAYYKDIQNFYHKGIIAIEYELDISTIRITVICKDIEALDNYLKKLYGLVTIKPSIRQRFLDGIARIIAQAVIEWEKEVIEKVHKALIF